MATRSALLRDRPLPTAGVRVAAVVVLAGLLFACGDDEPRATPRSTDTTAPSTTVTAAAVPLTTTPLGASTAAPAVTGATAPSTPCVIELHGKGGQGGDTTVEGGIRVVRPTGNASGWGARQWLYFPETEYTSALRVLTTAIQTASCTRVTLYGFSNGGAFAAKVFCRGETFDGRLAGVVIDDPVTDRAVEGCRPASGVKLALYWTGALEGSAVPGWSCAKGDWTCEGGSTLGITAYAGALGTPVRASPHRTHSPYAGVPEAKTWLT